MSNASTASWSVGDESVEIDLVLSDGTHSEGLTDSDESDASARASEEVESEMPAEASYYLTQVVSQLTNGLSVVPEPVTTRGPIPECNIYTGPGYGMSEVVSRAVDLVEERLVFKTAPTKVRIERPVEVVREVPKVVRREVVEFRKIVDPNDIIEVPKPYEVKTKHYVPNFVDKGKYVVMEERARPIVSQDEDPTQVSCLQVEPVMHVVDIYVPKVVNGMIITKKGVTRLHRLTELPTDTWDSLVKKVNPQLAGSQEGLELLASLMKSCPLKQRQTPDFS